MNKKNIGITIILLILILGYGLATTKGGIQPPLPKEKILDTQTCGSLPDYYCQTNADSTGYYYGQPRNNYNIKHEPENNIHETNYWVSGEHLEPWVSIQWTATHAKHVTKITIPINYNYAWCTDINVMYSPYYGNWETIYHNDNMQISDCDWNGLYNGDYYCNLKIENINTTMYKIRVSAHNNSCGPGAKENYPNAMAINDIKIEYIGLPL